MSPPYLATDAVILSGRWAVKKPKLVKWYLAHGADPNARGMHDETPLSNAVRDASFRTIRRMFRNGGSVEFGQLVHYAVHRKAADRLDVMQYLLGHGANVNKVQFQDHAPSFYYYGWMGLGTALHTVADAGDLEMVLFLVDQGARVDILDGRWRTAMERAQKKKHSTVVNYLQAVSETYPKETAKL
jgi:ankyrin repeat protein